MTIRLYLDEDTMDSDLLIALRKHGVDVVTVGEVQKQEELDEQQLLYAAEQGRVLYSFNIKHYMALHTTFLEQGLSHAGIILGQNGRWSVGEQMRRLLRIREAISAEEMKDRVEYLSSWGGAH